MSNFNMGGINYKMSQIQYITSVPSNLYVDSGKQIIFKYRQKKILRQRNKR